MTRATPGTALQTLADHPRAGDLARLAHGCLFRAAAARTLDLTTNADELASSLGLRHVDAETPLGNVLDAIKRPLDGASSSTLLAALLGRAVADEGANGANAQDTAAKLVWLAAHGGIDALAVIDPAMGVSAGPLWNAVADLVLLYDNRGTGHAPDALVAAASLADSDNMAARVRRDELSRSVHTPALRRLLAQQGQQPARVDAGSVELSGQIMPRPRGPVATILLALVGWLVVARAARLIGKLGLQYRRPAHVRLTEQGVVVEQHAELLGRKLRDSRVLLPIAALASATREVRYPRAGMYAGLIALALGSYLGITWIAQGVRVGSVSMAALGLLVVVVGLALDFVLISLLPGRKQSCRVVLVPRKGAPIAVGELEPAAADRFLEELGRR